MVEAELFQLRLLYYALGIHRFLGYFLFFFFGFGISFFVLCGPVIFFQYLILYYDIKWAFHSETNS